MLDRPPSLPPVILTGILAGCLMIASYAIGAGIVAAMIGLAGAALAVGSVVSFIDWMMHRAAVYYRARQDANSETPQVRVMRELARMTPEQIALANSLQAVIQLIPGDPAPVLYAVRIGDESVPYDFVRTFVALSDERNLPPIRQWPDGSIYRQYAVLLTNHLILMGLAKASAGNQSAAWVNKTRAARWLGLEQESQRMYGLVTMGK